MKGHQTNIFTLSLLQDLMGKVSSVNVGSQVRELLTVLTDLHSESQSGQILPGI